MSLILTSLTILMFFTLLSVVFGNSFITMLDEQASLTNTLVVNSSETELGISDYNILFEIDSISGAIAILILIVVIASALGIQILGSGLSDTAVKQITLVIVYAGLWTSLSILSFPLFIAIELFGSVIYVFLTLIYVIGVVRKLSGG